MSAIAPLTGSQRGATNVPGPAEGREGFLVAGAGSIGRRHLANLASLGPGDLRVYRTGAGLLPEGAALPAAVDRDLEAALQRRPRAVLVCNPTSRHLQVALAAARAGCDLLIEKPLSHDLEGVEELRREVEERGLVAMVGFQYRFHPTLRQVRDWVHSGRVGEVVAFRASWGEYLPGWHPGEDYRRGYSARRDLGGGAVLTLCHPFDYVRWLLGEVDAVMAMTTRASGLELEVEDTAQVVLRLRDGGLGSVGLDYSARPRAHGIEITARHGSIRWNEEDGTARLFDARAGRHEWMAPPAGHTRNDVFLAELRHFVACVEGRVTPRCGLDDGIQALRIAIAAKRSASEGVLVHV